MHTLTQEGLLGQAHRRAHRRLMAAIDGYLRSGAWDVRSTALYRQAERLVDALETEARWERAKAEMDYMQAHDHDWHRDQAIQHPDCDDCAEANQQMWQQLMSPY